MSENIWKLVAEDFDEKLARLTAISLKENDYSLAFFYPSGEPCLGYYYDYSQKSMYDTPPRLKINFMAYNYPGLAGVCGKNRVLFKKQTFFPSMVRREFAYENLGISGVERFGQKYADSMTWCADIKCLNGYHPFKKTMVTVVSSDEPFERQKKSKELF